MKASVHCPQEYATRSLHAARSGVAPNARGRLARLTFVAVVSVIALSLLGSSGPRPSSLGPGPVGAAPVPAFVPLLRLGDGGVLHLLSSGGAIVGQLTDRIVPGSTTGDYRSYTIQLTTRTSAPTVGIRLITDPVLQWGNPTQLPGGADALPPLSSWVWSIHQGTVDDTTHWSANFAPGTIGRNLTWGSYTFTVTGRVYAGVNLSVALNQLNGQHAPAVGYSMNGGLSPATNSNNDSDYVSLGQALNPGLVRFGLVDSGSSIAWDARHGQPVIGWVGFDRFPAYAQSVGAWVQVDLPVGTWGDGNYLPAGMPLDTAHPLALFHPNSPTGYFPTATAYAAYVSLVATHVEAVGEKITYWSIGNEVPLVNRSIADEYIQLFNTAAARIHAQIPGALVGSDVLTNRTFIDDFAHNATGVGFLAFHFYGSLGMCVQNGSYCPPQGAGLGTPDGLLMSPAFDLAHAAKFVAPHLAQIIYHNVTGHWLPVYDAETNLHAAGGPAQYGTDPRQQTVFAGAWLGSLLTEAAQENLSALTYYTLTGNTTIPTTFTAPFGGYGFGMTTEGTHDNDTRYAPYWALQLWSSGLPAGASLLTVNGSNPITAEALAAQNGSQVSVLVVNRANLTVPVSVSVSGDGTATPVSLQVLDYASYARYTSTLTRSGGPLSPFNVSHPTGSTPTFVLHGYSLALLTLNISDPALPPPKGSTPAVVPFPLAALAPLAPSALASPSVRESDAAPRWAPVRAV